MYFYELLKQCDVEVIVQEFLLLCVDSQDINIIEKKIRNVIDNLKEMKVNISHKEIIVIEKVQTEDEKYDEAFMIDTSDEIKYGLEINPWSNTLGYRIDDDSLSEFIKERFVALVLWEMTWLGFDEDSIQEYVKSWDD